MLQTKYRRLIELKYSVLICNNDGVYNNRTLFKDVNCTHV